MKLQSTAILMFGLMAIPAMAQNQQSAPAATPPPALGFPAAPGIPAMPDMDSVSYAIGMTWGATLKRNAPEANVDTIAKSIKDVISGTAPRFTEAEAQKILRDFQVAYQAKIAEKGKKEGEEFLTKNRTEPGVVVLPSGLQYKVMTEGTGPIPTASDTVSVNYRGTLLNGTEFDSSYKRNKPLDVGVSGGIIKGWTEALQLMKVGSKWKVFIPSNLAYGERANGSIPPNSALIFEMELLAINPPAPANPQAVSGDIIKVPSAADLKNGAKPEIIKVAPPTK